MLINQKVISQPKFHGSIGHKNYYNYSVMLISWLITLRWWPLADQEILWKLSSLAILVFFLEMKIAEDIFPPGKVNSLSHWPLRKLFHTKNLWPQAKTGPSEGLIQPKVWRGIIFLKTFQVVHDVL